jgi:chlorite dismutase
MSRGRKFFHGDHPPALAWWRGPWFDAGSNLAKKFSNPNFPTLMKTPDNDSETSPNPEIKSVIPHEGWHVLHLFYRVDYGLWEDLSPQEMMERRTRFVETVQKAREHEDTQVLSFAMSAPFDVGFMVLTPDLQVANAIEKRLSRALGPDVLALEYSYLSVTESSEYTTSDDDYEKQLREQGEPEIEAKMQEFRERMKHYLQHRLYPKLPDWPVFCFYPMSKTRLPGANWYSLPFEERKQLMGGHARMGRQWSGKILQLITGSTGLDSHEWGVTLFAHDSKHINQIVYQMRFDEVSAKYGEFGPFYIGLQLEPGRILERLDL